VALLDADPSAGVVYGDRAANSARGARRRGAGIRSAGDALSNSIDACAVLRPRGLERRRRLWTPRSPPGGIGDFWLGAAGHGWRFIRIPRTTFEYRIRPDSMLQSFQRRTDFPEHLPSHLRKTSRAPYRSMPRQS